VSIQPALDLWVFHYFCPSWPVHSAICYISLSAGWIIRPIDCAIFCMASNFIISFPTLIHLPLRSHLLMFDRSTELQQAGMRSQCSTPCSMLQYLLGGKYCCYSQNMIDMMDQILQHLQTNRRSHH
jgi:hypothetical protein